MPAIVADLQALDAVAHGLVRTGQQLRGAGGALQPPGGVLGPPGLEAAVTEFCDAWRRGLQRTAEAADVAGGQLRDAVAAYARLESALAAVGA